VSRSHQNQAFQLRVGPNVALSSLDGDVAPCLSPLVTVRSKRNHRKKTTPSEDAGVLVHRSEHETYANLVEGPGEVPLPLLGAGASMQEALTNVLGWIDHVLRTVQGMKWTPIGYERSSDGQMDMSRPLYSMRNPNQDIDRVLNV